MKVFKKILKGIMLGLGIYGFLCFTMPYITYNEAAYSGLDIINHGENVAEVLNPIFGALFFLPVFFSLMAGTILVIKENVGTILIAVIIDLVSLILYAAGMPFFPDGFSGMGIGWRYNFEIAVLQLVISMVLLIIVYVRATGKSKKKNKK